MALRARSQGEKADQISLWVVLLITQKTPEGPQGAAVYTLRFLAPAVGQTTG